MERVTRTPATADEISLTGADRNWFERTPADNVRRAVRDLPGASVTRPARRALVDTSEPVAFAGAAPWREIPVPEDADA